MSATSDWEPPSIERLHEMLPQYEVTAIIGRGGMGAVYRGRQAKLDRDVAIKLLPETFTDGEDELNFAERFKLEARSMAKLDHPAIVSVYDFGETSDGQLYIVMEFIDGVDIHHYLHQHGGKLPQEHALSIAAHVLDALEFAHKRGIVHRDIKPANILMNREGRVKIADFGLAKTLSAAGEDSVPALTMTNVAVGTPDFVAPEALDSDKTPDHRADLYAVGVMLYQMLTGSLPRGKFKLPSDIRPELDPRLDAIIDKTLESDPEERYSSASEVRAALDPVFTTPITKVEAEADAKPEAVPVAIAVEEKAAKPAATPKPKKAEAPKPPVYLGIGLAALLLIGGVAAFLMKGDKGDEAAGATSASPPAPKEEAPPRKEVGRDVPGEPSTVSKTPAPPQPLPSPGTGPAKPTPGSNQPTPTVAAAPSPAKTPNATAPEKGNTSSDPSAPTESSEKGPVPEMKITTSVSPEPKVTSLKAAEAVTEASPGLASISGLKTRIDGYLAARRKQVGELTTNYLRGLDARLNQAADAGDLKLTRAFQNEKKRAAELQASLVEPPPDSIAAVSETATLADLPDDTPAAVTALRKTWTTERQKIRETLGRQLQQSLKALEAQLTKKREFENAEALLAFRESLVAQPAADEMPKPATAVVASEDLVQENPFNWKPISKEPFPLPIPERPKTPCRVVAWRMDGKPIDEAKFIERFGGVPNGLGEVVNFETNPELVDNPVSNSSFPLGLRADGSVVALRKSDAESVLSDLSDVVSIASSQFIGAALKSDGRVIPLTFNRGSMNAKNASVNDAKEWSEIVEVKAGWRHLVGLKSDGSPVTCGSDEVGQTLIPGEARSRVFRIGAHKNYSWFANLEQNGDVLVKRVGDAGAEDKVSAGGRFFWGAGSALFITDSRGKIDHFSRGDAPNHHENLGGKTPRDIAWMAMNQISWNDTVVGISAARDGKDYWRFWGNLGGIAGLDPKINGIDSDHCEQRATGSLKVILVAPYVLALKPVANLKPDDWTG